MLKSMCTTKRRYCSFFAVMFEFILHFNISIYRNKTVFGYYFSKNSKTIFLFKFVVFLFL